MHKEFAGSGVLGGFWGGGVSGEILYVDALCGPCIKKGSVCFVYSWSFLLTVELLCLQSVEVLIRSISHCKQRSLNGKEKNLNCK